MGAALQADGEYEVRVYGLKHQKEKRSMDHFAGLDVSVKETSVCIVDDSGKITREVKVASEPDALLAVLKMPIGRMGPPLRSFAADAHDCIVVRVLGPTGYKVVARLNRARKRAPL